MKIICDTNIFLDVLLEREPYVDASAKVLRLCEEHKLEGYVSASCVTDIFYIVRKYLHSNAQAYKAIGKVFEIVKICSVTNNDVLNAYQMQAKDFEDCLLAMCAKSIGCDGIITRNGKDFVEFGIPLYEPLELIEMMEK